MNLRRLMQIILLVALVLFGAGVVAAQTNEVTDDQVNEVAKDLFCPVCESTPLDVCPTQACADWRELIREQLAEGYTRDEIHQYFARQYGDGVLADPPKSGFSLIIWFVPILAVVVAGVFFVRFMSQLRQGSGEEALPASQTVATSQSEPKPQPETAVMPEPTKPEPPAAPASADISTDAMARIEAELSGM